MLELSNPAEVLLLDISITRVEDYLSSTYEVEKGNGEMVNSLCVIIGRTRIVTILCSEESFLSI